MFKGIFKKADVILLAVLVAAGLIASLAVARSGHDGGSITVKVGGKTAGSSALDEDRTLLITSDGTVREAQDQESGSLSDYNIIQIKNGSVNMTEADCHNQVCVNHKPISRTGQSIICLPHKVVVEITSGKEDGDYDTISQ